jgi:hypothetical protein
LETFIVTHGYASVFLIAFVINVIPAFMPPTWVVLSTVHFLFPQSFAPILLALTGTFASTFGRVVLCRIGVASRRLMGEERRTSMEGVAQALRSKRYGGFLSSFLFAIGPLPSNIYFLAVGMTRFQSFSVFLGFWLGRLISYWALVSVTHVAYQSLAEIFTSQLQAIIIIDSLGIVSMIIFTLIDWEKLFREKRIVFIKPKLKCFSKSSRIN